MKRFRVAVVCGGPSPEAEVSRVSGGCVAEALDARGHLAQLIELTPRLPEDLAGFSPDTVAPILHGAPGEDGSVQALLDILGYSYVGSGQAASATAIHKSLTKAIARSAGLPVAKDLVVTRGDNLQAVSQEASRSLGASLVIKPDDQGSALGVGFLRNASQEELRDRLDEALSVHERVLLEPFIEGAELTVGVLDLQGEDSVAFPVIEIRTPENTWYDFHHRYTPGESEHLLPAPIPEEAAEKLRTHALELHRLLGCQDLSRTDFIRAASGEIIMLELNNLPGMTPTSLYPDGARAIGIEFEDLVERLVVSAIARGPAINWNET